jgi:ribose/xylose/arabinose/galactoside ABC-type transport system permease subunit
MQSSALPKHQITVDKKASIRNEAAILVITLAIGLALAIAKPEFRNAENLYSILFGVSMDFFAIVGLTFLLIMGEVDLSIGSVYGVAGALSGYFMLKIGWPAVPSVIAALAVSAAIGLVNGFFIVRMKVNSMMMTLGMMLLLQGVLNAITSSLGGATYPSAFRAFSRARVMGLDISVFLMILAVALLQFLLRKHIAFRKLYYIGENLASSRIYGVPVDRIKQVAYIVCSVMAAFAGILNASRVGVTMPYTGAGLEFKMVTAAVLGGASMQGGKGSMLGSFLGLTFLALILNGMVMCNTNPDWQPVVIGIILVAAVVMDTRSRKKRM